MSLVTFLLIGFIIFLLYRSSMEEARLLLSDTAKGYANLIEAVVDFDAIHSTDFPGGPREATLSRVQADFQGDGNHRHLPCGCHLHETISSIGTTLQTTRRPVRVHIPDTDLIYHGNQ